jgi:hypothetical protein
VIKNLVFLFFLLTFNTKALLAISQSDDCSLALHFSRLLIPVDISYNPGVFDRETELQKIRAQTAGFRNGIMVGKDSSLRFLADDDLQKYFPQGRQLADLLRSDIPRFSLQHLLIVRSEKETQRGFPYYFSIHAFFESKGQATKTGYQINITQEGEEIPVIGRRPLKALKAAGS